MKNLSLCLIVVFCWMAMQSCKKGSEEVVPTPVVNTNKPVVYKDSVYFTINQTKYVFDQWLGFGAANYPVNIKKSLVKIADRKLAYETGGYYWYGAPDSTLYAAKCILYSNTLGDFELSFTKKFKDSELVRYMTLLYPQSHEQLFKTGEFGFAVDLGKANTTEGVVLEFYESNLNSLLSSNIPGDSKEGSDAKKGIQHDSSFNVTKVEKTKEGMYIIEARFELNLFDKNGHLYRLKDGFLKVLTATFYH
jgi:hypothetical protein